MTELDHCKALLLLAERERDALRQEVRKVREAHEETAAAYHTTLLLKGEAEAERDALRQEVKRLRAEVEDCKAELAELRNVLSR